MRCLITSRRTAPLGWEGSRASSRRQMPALCSPRGTERLSWRRGCVERGGSTVVLRSRCILCTPENRIRSPVIPSLSPF